MAGAVRPATAAPEDSACGPRDAAEVEVEAARAAHRAYHPDVERLGVPDGRQHDDDGGLAAEPREVDRDRGHRRAAVERTRAREYRRRRRLELWVVERQRRLVLRLGGRH